VPTYGYRCQKCGEEFDVWQRMSDEAKADCPVCGAPGKRLFFPAGIVFKGSGFYKTDSRGSSSSTSPASSEAKKDTAKDAKPAKPAASEPSTPSKPSTSSSTAAAAAD
jgi:putative FmdB family regulatory protein